jgi:hypothetical protein
MLLKKPNVKRTSPWLLLVVLAPLCLGSVAARAQQEKAANSPALDELNSLFLEGYKRRREQVRDATTPVLVVNFGTLELHSQGQIKKENGIPPIYHHLKAVAHVPLGLYARITYYRHAPAPAAFKAEMATYRDKIQAAASSLETYGFNEKQLARQEKILSASLKIADEAIQGLAPHELPLEKFVRQVGPLILQNADEAAVAQIDLTHQRVMAWKKSLTPAEWEKLIVIVRGFQMPRRYNIATVYFSWLLNEKPHRLGYPGESRRLIYAEFMARNNTPLDLMATTLLDGDASEAFFGNRWRLSRDILADGARGYVKKLKRETAVESR